MKDKVFLDTNILVYLANEDSSFHAVVKDKFKELAAKSELWISRQVLREYAVVMSRSGIIEKSLTSAEIVSDLTKWGTICVVADETEEITGFLKKLIQAYNIKGKRIHDANIVATMMVNTIAFLFTLNVDDFKGIKEVELITV